MALIVPGIPVARRGVRLRFSNGRWFSRIVIGAAGLAVLVAIVAPLVAPDSVTSSDIANALHGPSAQHWFGTDDQGRDVLWRVVAGSRASLLSALLVVAAYSVIGGVVAAIAALGGRFLDEIFMRFTDAVMAIPTIVFALGFAAALGPGLHSAIIALSITAWPVTARLLRTEIQQTMTRPYVEGARVLGVGRTRLLFRHVLPNSLDALLVKWGADVGSTVLVISGLSFIGVGPQPPSPEWGAMVNEGAGYIGSAWWMAVFPGIAIAFVAVVFALLADVVQERLAAGRS
ncbi:MAG TPA: ABC transporter permease [Marmoricola sp.]|jgi:peptide/nickel transport system permease protein|nr:ABC transporter permease [Marmoricola sp.]